jgi:hypothetical protein
VVVPLSFIGLDEQVGRHLADALDVDVTLLHFDEWVEERAR